MLTAIEANELMNKVYDLDQALSKICQIQKLTSEDLHRDISEKRRALREFINKLTEAS